MLHVLCHKFLYRHAYQRQMLQLHHLNLAPRDSILLILSNAHCMPPLTITSFGVFRLCVNIKRPRFHRSEARDLVLCSLNAMGWRARHVPVITENETVATILDSIP